MLIEFVFLAALFVSSIMTALSRKQMTNTLIKAENEEDLVKTFRKFENEQYHYKLSGALGDVAQVPEHMPKVATCLRAAVDPFPKETSNVCYLVYLTVGVISNSTRGDTESFVKVITSFQPSDAKPLASIRYLTLYRKDAVKVLESVMARSPELITGSLSRWLASHGFDQTSDGYTRYEVAREQTFQYLTSFATEDALNDALSIVTKNEHYKRDSIVDCCNSQKSFPQGLVTKLESLLAIVKARNALINEALIFLPSVLVGMVADYLPPITESIT